MASAPIEPPASPAKVLFVSHCLLNAAAKVRSDDPALADEARCRRRLLALALEHDVQLVQMPCPELLLAGHLRWGQVREQYDFPAYRRGCDRLLEPVLDELEELLAQPGWAEVVGVVSVEGSPNCGLRLTCSSTSWSGEPLGPDGPRDIPQATMVGAPGVFVERLVRLLGERGLAVPLLTMEEALSKLERL